MIHACIATRRLGPVLAAWAFASTAGTAAVTPGNLLVANGGRVYEYTPAGGFVQAVTGDLRNGVFAESRGLAYDALGRVHVLIRPHDGDVDMFLATVAPATGAVGHRSLAFHNHNGNTTYGDIGADGAYVYAPDQVFNRQAQGVVRYPLAGGSPDRVLTALDPTDVSVGRDGLLYVQRSDGFLSVVNPATLATVRSFDVGANIRDVEATAAGDVFVLHARQVDRYTPAGTLVDTLALPFNANHSMALSAAGRIVVGSAGEALFLTDTALDGFTTVATPNSQELNWGNFVTFAEPVPEPSVAAAAATVAGAGLLGRRRRRRLR